MAGTLTEGLEHLAQSFSRQIDAGGRVLKIIDIGVEMDASVPKVCRPSKGAAPFYSTIAYVPLSQAPQNATVIPIESDLADYVQFNNGIIVHRETAAKCEMAHQPYVLQPGTTRIVE